MKNYSNEVKEDDLAEQLITLTKNDIKNVLNEYKKNKSWHENILTKPDSIIKLKLFYKSLGNESTPLHSGQLFELIQILLRSNEKSQSTVDVCLTFLKKRIGLGLIQYWDLVYKKEILDKQDLDHIEKGIKKLADANLLSFANISSLVQDNWQYAEQYAESLISLNHYHILNSVNRTLIIERIYASEEIASALIILHRRGILNSACQKALAKCHFGSYQDLSEGLVILNENKILNDENVTEMVKNNKHAKSLANAFVTLNKHNILNHENKMIIAKYQDHHNTYNFGYQSNYPEQIADALVLLHQHHILNEDNRCAVISNQSDYANRIVNALLSLHNKGILDRHNRNAICSDVKYADSIVSMLIFLLDNHIYTTQNREYIYHNVPFIGELMINTYKYNSFAVAMQKNNARSRYAVTLQHLYRAFLHYNTTHRFDEENWTGPALWAKQFNFFYQETEKNLLSSRTPLDSKQLLTLATLLPPYFLSNKEIRFAKILYMCEGAKLLLRLRALNLLTEKNITMLFQEIPEHAEKIILRLENAQKQQLNTQSYLDDEIQEVLASQAVSVKQLKNTTLGFFANDQASVKNFQDKENDKPTVSSSIRLQHI